MLLFKADIISQSVGLFNQTIFRDYRLLALIGYLVFDVDCLCRSQVKWREKFSVCNTILMKLYKSFAEWRVISTYFDSDNLGDWRPRFCIYWLIFIQRCTDCWYVICQEVRVVEESLVKRPFSKVRWLFRFVVKHFQGPFADTAM